MVKHSKIFFFQNQRANDHLASYIVLGPWVGSIIVHQSFVSTAPSGPGISVAFNFSIFKAPLKALLSGAKIVVKSLLKASALPGADNNEEHQMT